MTPRVSKVNSFEKRAEVNPFLRSLPDGTSSWVREGGPSGSLQNAEAQMKCWLRYFRAG
jgi:hypothetical protein